jgi:hypothetical protein
LQQQYIEELLKQYNMQDCYAASTLMTHDFKITDKTVNDKRFVKKYQAVVESLQFLATYTRSDISFVAGFLERHSHALT